MEEQECGGRLERIGDVTVAVASFVGLVVLGFSIAMAWVLFDPTRTLFRNQKGCGTEKPIGTEMGAALRVIVSVDIRWIQGVPR